CAKSMGCAKGSGRGEKSSESVPIGIMAVGFWGIAVAVMVTPTITLTVFAAAGTLVGSICVCQVASESCPTIGLNEQHAFTISAVVVTSTQLFGVASTSIFTW